MTPEASALSASAALFFVMIIVQGALSARANSPAALLGSRDRLNPDHPMCARAKRANQNMLEAMAMFVPLMLVAIVTDRTNEMTALGGWLFLAGRAAFAPIYWFGVAYLRTLAWFVGLSGTVLVFLQVLPFTGA